MTYQIHFTEQAAVKRDALDVERRGKFDKGIALIAENPHLELSRAMSADGEYREVRLTSQIMVEYMINRGQIVVVIIEIFDDKDIVVE